MGVYKSGVYGSGVYKSGVYNQRWPDTEYAMADDEGYLIVDDEDNVVVGIDYFTTALIVTLY